MYMEDDLLMLSGIQHFYFCQRQWALIHIEQQWEENHLTFEGRQIHEKVDDPFFFESRGDLRISRGMPIVSFQLGLNGVADVVEFRRLTKDGNIEEGLENGGVLIEGCQGFWRPRPVEYKHGKPKPDRLDEIQLCAQAICLEEMFHIHIMQGDLYYWKPKKRLHVDLTEDLRQETHEIADKMHKCFDKGVTQIPSYKNYCNSCSLRHICIPEMNVKSDSVRTYLKSALHNEVF